MDETKLKRKWWRKKRWWAAGLLWLAVGYPLSGGPAAYCAARGWCPVTPLALVYWPLDLATRPFPGVRDVLTKDYGRWWRDLAKRHAAEARGAAPP